MDTYAIQAVIMKMDNLNTNEKCLAMCLAHAKDKGTDKVRRTRKWMSEATGQKGGTVRRTIAALVEKGVIVPQRTGRSTIYAWGVLVKECGRVDGPLGDHQTVPVGTITSSLVAVGRQKKKRSGGREKVSLYHIPTHGPEGERLCRELELDKLERDCAREAGGKPWWE